MNRKQRFKRKQNVKEFQAKKTAYNKANPIEHEEEKKIHALERKARFDKKEKRRLVRIKKKRTKRLKSLKRRKIISVEEYQEKIARLK